MILLTHPGTQHSYHIARQLARNSQLAEFWTGFALPREAWYTKALNSCLPATWRKKIANRIIDELPAEYLRTMPLIEFKALKELQNGKSPQAVFYARNQAFQERIPDSAIRNASAVIGFDTASWITVKRAKVFSKPFFLDQSIAYPLVHEAVLQRVIRRFPKWKESFESRNPVVLECEREEHHLATKIVVASSYTKKTLVAQGVKSSKIAVNPYGVDLSRFSPSYMPRADRPLRFLFLGTISARKGVPLLLEAWAALGAKDCELWLVGPVAKRELALIPSLPGLKVIGKHPHEELPDLIRQCDVLVFPSYCEGFGLVLLEALASGLPVITTEATAGPDLIQNGVEGFLIQSGDLDALSRSMQFFVSNPEELKQMSAAARRCAEQYSWNAYGDRWCRLLRECG